MKKLCLAAFFATTLFAMATPGDGLKGWDKNTDGNLNKTEFKEAVASDVSYSKFDKNTDGKLDKTELSTAVTELDSVAPVADAGKKGKKAKKAGKKAKKDKKAKKEKKKGN